MGEVNPIIVHPGNFSQCETQTRPRMPCYACAVEGPNDYQCGLNRGHSGDEHRAITTDGDVIKWKVPNG